MKKLLFLIGVMLVCASLLAQSELRVDPPHWWAGMFEGHLQLMVYGRGIGEFDADLDYEGVTLQGFHPGDSKNYLFVDLMLSPTVKPGIITLKFKHRGKTTKHYYELKQRNPDSADRQSFDSSDAIYLITPDRFANGDYSNDEVNGMKEGLNREFHGGRHGGDLQGVTENLEYIKDLGFTAIWLNPVLENNMEKWSYHGYSTTDFYRVDPRYGSLNSYHELCDKAHSMGMKVIADQIENHCGSEHWWMADLPFNDWINNNGKFVQTTHRRETIQDPYTSANDKRGFSDGWFDSTMPDLNQRNPYLALYLIQNSIWWVEEVGLDGIRQDTYPYPDKDFMSAWSHAIIEEYPKFRIVGEEWSLNPNIVSYWQRDKVNHDGYVSYLPSVMDFPLQAALSNALQEEIGQWSEKFADLYRCLANDYLYPQPQELVIFPDNHDMDRFYTQIGEDFEMWKMGIAYLCVTRGIPQFYYGTVILMSNGEDGSHGVIRADFPGGWDNDTVDAVAGKGLDIQQEEAMDYMRTLLTWRQGSETIHSGNTMHFAPLYAGRRYVLFRYTEEEIVMLIMNKSDKEDILDLKEYAEVLKGKRMAMDVISGQQLTLDNELKVPSRSAMILQFR